MNTRIEQTAQSTSAGECLTPEPWEFLLLTDRERRHVLERFPTLTAIGYYPYERYERENDRRGELMAFPSLASVLTAQDLLVLRRTPPIPIDSPAVREHIARVRLFLRSVTGDWIGGHTSYNVRSEIVRWAGVQICHGAVIAGSFLEGRIVARQGTAACIGLRVPAAVHFRLQARAATALAVIDAALACVPQ